MLNQVFTSKEGGFHWIDLVDPTPAELNQLSKNYNLPASFIRSCLDPKHLPKCQFIKDHIFIILRAYDEKASKQASTTRGLTRKLVILVGNNYIITIHRKDQPFIAYTREKWIKNKENTEGNTLVKLLAHLIQSVLLTYNPPMTLFHNKLENFENLIFTEIANSASIQAKFFLKRRAYVFKRMFKFTLDLLPKLKIISDYDEALYQELKETTENELFDAENVLEHVNNLINLQLLLASYHTNEIIRILTIFSIYFLPATFIAAIYGMNFKYMPELEWKYGYPATLVVIFIVSYLLYLWVKRRKWM